jgi:hypothetical protein
MGDNGRLLIGEKGFILATGTTGPGAVYPESCAKDAAEVAHTLPRSDGHYKEFIEACKGGKPAGSNFDWAGPLAEGVLLGNVALRSQLRDDLTLYRLKWDAASLKITNLEEANRYIKREYREGWTL